MKTMISEPPKYKVGDEVFWTDPDEGICSGNGKVTKVGEIYSVKKDDGGELEAYEHELTLHPEPCNMDEDGVGCKPKDNDR
tara:strand:+ start:1908 stop:2150 length:243 start_codon:yes stop_codon:yes gene_type:complete